ncbi:macrophage mannose receptor 1-like [Mya arenaria]|uniref:macrophage mannose receptor 1-like n=1 Tax=Mya arenaria TaxID=6604 RepID=UPI0022E59C3A|nr:macrophage mannose receptor 1-like [Mya arenaria]
MLRYFVLVLHAFQVTRADYDCICNYNVELPVFLQMSNTSTYLGPMFKNDCRASVAITTQDPHWFPVQYDEHRIGYVEYTEGVRLQTCSSVSSVTSTEATTTATLPTPASTASTTVVDSTTLTAHVTTVQYGCAEKYFQHAITFHGKLFTIDNTCYELVNTTKSWTSAEDDCQRRGGHLVHIQDDVQQNRLYGVVKQYLHRHVWIGLNDREAEEHFIWSSGDPVNYTNWHPGRDSPVPEFLLHEDCVRMDMSYTGQWDDVRCGDALGYICEFATSPLSATTTAAPNALLDNDGDVHVCPRQVQYYAQTNNSTVGQFNQSCYELLKTRVTWRDADDICKRSGGHLVSINDATEQHYIQAFMSRHGPNATVWIGLFDRRSEGVYHWLSGEKVGYTNWVSGHVTHKSKDCVILDPSRGGVWDDGDCTSSLFSKEDRHYGFCEFKLMPASHAAVLVG